MTSFFMAILVCHLQAGVVSTDCKTVAMDTTSDDTLTFMGCLGVEGQVKAQQWAHDHQGWVVQGIKCSFGDGKKPEDTDA